MLGTGLYYPHIDIRDTQWLRSAILFWDKIHTIVPSSIEDPYQQPDTLECLKEGYLSPLHCDLHEDILSDLGSRVLLKLFNDNDWIWEARNKIAEPIGRSLVHADKFSRELQWEIKNVVGIHPAKMPPELRAILAGPIGFQLISRGKINPDLMNMLEDIERYRMHPGKMSHWLRRLISRYHDDEWIMVDRRFGEIYMSSLAALLSKELEISPLTNEERSSGINLHFIGDDISSNSPSAARGALVSIVMKGLKVDPETPINKILKFRKKRETQLANLAGEFDELKKSIENSSEGGDIQDNATRVFENKIMPELEKLKHELKGETIQSIWSGFQTASTFSAVPSTALWATGFEAPIVLGTSAFITAAGIGVKSYLARSKLRSKSTYTYLLDIERDFCTP